jgi:hypothetical protein
MSDQSPRERARRFELVDDTKKALASERTVEDRVHLHEHHTRQWHDWFTRQMELSGASNPLELIPRALGELTMQTHEAIGVEIRNLKADLLAALGKVLK